MAQRHHRHPLGLIAAPADELHGLDPTIRYGVTAFPAGVFGINDADGGEQGEMFGRDDGHRVEVYQG